MSTPNRLSLSPRTQLYVFAVAAAGLAAIVWAVADVLGHPWTSAHIWLSLAAFTFLSGWLSVKLPAVDATISISETFVFAGTLLFGASIGVLLSVLDVLAICLKHGWLKGRLRWQQVIFNFGAPPVSIWCAARVTGMFPRGTLQLDTRFVLALAIFTALYFLLNSWLVALAVALEKRSSPIRIWRTSFTELSVNFAAGASIAAFLVVNESHLNLAFLGVILPLLLVIYFTYQWSLKHVEAEREKIQGLNRVFLSTIEALALAIDAKDQVTHGHIRRVQRYTMALAEALGVKSEQELDALRAAALLHDTGKLAVPEYILNKPGPLTAAEFERMKVHADVGADILKSIDFPYPVEPIVRHHHERWDGNGYPRGLRDQEIPLGARMLAVVDCYDALTSDRPYRPRLTRQQAEQELRDRRGTAYDPWVVDTFLALLDDLEEAEAADRRKHAASPRARLSEVSPDQLDVISATTAEEREFNELRRDLPRAGTLASATEVLFGHLRRVVPATTLGLYLPRPDTNDVHMIACFGVGSATLEGLNVTIGEKVSGWVFANSQTVINSDATLELGPVARTFSAPLRYAAGVPIVDGGVVGVIVAFGSEPFEKDHRRLLENAATLFVSSISHSLSDQSPREAAVKASVRQQPSVH
jgi:putative nucleotidyltransferase with HDIG domain